MHLKLPRVRPVIGFFALIPFVVPPIILVVGLLRFYKDTLHAPFWFLGRPDLFLVSAYVILAFPYIYFSLDAGFRAIDVHTLTEASQNLGASWRTTLFRVILPNIRVAALSGAFLTLAIVMGEFTIATLSSFQTFPTYIQYVNETKAYPAAAVTLISFGITWAAMLSLLLIGSGTAVGRCASGSAGRRDDAAPRAPGPAPRHSAPSSRCRGSTSRSRRASSSRCSARAAAARRPRCVWLPDSTGPDAGRIVVDGRT